MAAHFQLAGLLIAFVGIVLTVLFYIRRRRRDEHLSEELNELPNKISNGSSDSPTPITWNQLQNYCRELRSEIESKFDPEILVTPGLRGAIIAYLMYGTGAHEDFLYFIGIQNKVPNGEVDDGHETGTSNFLDVIGETSKYEYYLPKPFPDELADENILIVDDYAHTGESLETFEEYLLENGVDTDSIRTATVVCSSKADEFDKEPDFHGPIEDLPFEFPWGDAR